MCDCSSKSQQPSHFNWLFNQQNRQLLANKLTGAIGKRLIQQAKYLAVQLLGDFATIIFTNGKIYTMDDKIPIAQSVAIRHNKIIKVGKLENIQHLKNNKTQIIDLKGKIMLPGFIDPHIHMCFCLIDHWLDLGPYINKTLNEAKIKLLHAIRNADQNYLLTAKLFDPQVMLGDFDYSRKGLDLISDKIGIFILEANGHVAHVNSAAFKLVGVDKDTIDPSHGRFVRDANGELTGQVQQLAVNNFKSKFPTVSAEQYELNFKNFLNYCATKGCTSLHDCGIGFIDPKADLSLLLDTFNHQTPVRYSGMLVSTKWNIWKQEKLVPNNTDNDLRINGIKCWVDGSIQGGSAFLRQNYSISQWKKGHPNYSQSILQQAIQVANDDGWQVGIHANGDAGIDMVLDTFQKINKKNSHPQLRHRIQHSTICHPEQLQRMKKLNLSPSFLIGHIYYYGDVLERVLGQQRANLVDPLKTAFKLGLKPTIHSDYNCQPVDPLRCIQNAITRKIKKSGRVLNENQCVTCCQAIKAVTINAAWQSHLDDIVGSIQEGKLADFVILNQDPHIVNSDQIMDIKILQTWMDGKITYNSRIAEFTKGSKLKQQLLQKDNPEQNICSKVQQIQNKQIVITKQI